MITQLGGVRGRAWILASNGAPVTDTGHIGDQAKYFKPSPSQPHLKTMYCREDANLVGAVYPSKAARWQCTGWNTGSGGKKT